MKNQTPLAPEAHRSPALAPLPCSLPGSEADHLIALWQHLGNLHAASKSHGRDRYGQGYSKGLADAYTIAAEQLRARLADANGRQPEENAPSEPPPSPAGQLPRT
jgi:hypothetical protein